MVSGLVTSPWDQLRIFSGEASEMRMASKSVIGLVSSNGLERYKSTLLGTLLRIDNSKACLAAIPGVILLGLSSPGVRTGLVSISTAWPAACLVRRCDSRRRKSLLRLLDQFDIETERLQLTNEHVERFWYAGLDGCLALDDGLVDLGTAIDVIGLGSQQLLQDVGRTVCFERPHFHLTETLPTELRLATQRLLRDERIRSDRTSVNLVVDQVGKLQHVDVAHSCRLFELLARHAVKQRRLAGAG